MGVPVGMLQPGQAAATSTAGPASTAGEGARLQDDIVSEAVVEAVLSGRRRFLRYQSQRDGELLAGSVDVNPVDVVEDIADMIIEDVLHEHAKGSRVSVGGRGRGQSHPKCKLAEMIMPRPARSPPPS